MPLKNDPILSGRSIWLFRHLELQNPSIISDFRHRSELLPATIQEEEEEQEQEQEEYTWLLGWDGKSYNMGKKSHMKEHCLLISLLFEIFYENRVNHVKFIQEAKINVKQNIK